MKTKLLYTQRIPTCGGDEKSLFSRWRYLVVWYPGQRSYIKRKYHKRWRRIIKVELKNYLIRRKV